MKVNKEKSIEDKYKVLNHIEHILLRPQTYLGSNKFHTEVKYLLNKDKMVKDTITYVPSFLKIFDEIITNAVDEHQRNNKLNKIEVNINQKTGEISVKDNGGIPVILHKELKKYVPEIIFGTLMSGSNYDDSDERTGAGVNGYGSKLTNIFSKKFIVSTCDGKKSLYQEFSNNMKDRKDPIIKSSKTNHTEIKYIPDYEKFGLDELNDEHLRIIEKRVYDIAACNPKLKIYFNGNFIDISSFDDYIKLYTDIYIFDSNKDKNWSIGISDSDNGFQQVSFVNSIETYDGGTHVDYVLNQIILYIKEFMIKKHKIDLKPSEIKNHIFLFLNSTVINPSFSSQTKEKLITESKAFGIQFELTEKFKKDILKSEIINRILDWNSKKLEANDAKLTRELNKSLSKIKVDKLIDAKGKIRTKCILGIYEGDSAIGSFRKYRNPETMGAFPLKGKFTNVTDVSKSKLSQNDEVIGLMAAIGLKFGEKVDRSKLRYGRIYLVTDQDFDGYSIASLLLNFFNTFWPELFEYEMIYKIDTPLLVATSKIKKNEEYKIYSIDEFNEWLIKNDVNKYNISYKKGLSALSEDNYNDMVNNPKLTLIKKSDVCDDKLDIWFGNNSELRKKELLVD